MKEEVKEKELSTADVVAAAEKHRDQPTGLKELEKDMTPAQPPANARPAALLVTEETENFRSRWNTIQTGFVDEPRRSVEQADALVAELMKRLAQVFADERAKLEGQWGRGDNVSTEDLRVALQRYRSFFDRLLSV
jgi:hypothetical protein